MGGPDDRSPFEALAWYWGRYIAFRDLLDGIISKRFPLAVRIGDWLLRQTYGVIVSPPFALILTFLLVGLAISEVVPIIVSVSVLGAWLVAILSIARYEAVRKLRILEQIIVVTIAATLMASAGYWYIRWCLVHYYAKHTVVAPQTETAQTGTDELAYKRFKELLDEQTRTIGARLPPVRSSAGSTSKTVTTSPSIGCVDDNLSACSVQDLCGRLSSLTQQIDERLVSRMQDLHAQGMQTVREGQHHDESQEQWQERKREQEFAYKSFAEIDLRIYNEEYKEKAILYHKELLNRLGPSAITPHIEGQFTQPLFWTDIRDANVDLKKLSDRLCH